MSKELDKLIEHVLMEKGINNKLIPADPDELDLKEPPKGTIDPDTDKYIPSDAEKAWRKLGVSRTNKDGRGHVRNLATQGGAKATLNYEDITAAIKKNLDYFQGKTSEANTKALKAIKRILKGPTAKPGVDDSVSKKYSEKVKDLITKTLLELPAGTLTVPAPELTKQIISTVGKLETDDGVETDDVNPFAGQTMPRRSLEADPGEFIKSDSGAGIAKASPYLVNLFASVEGDSIVSKLTSIMEFAKAAAEGTIDKWVNPTKEKEGDPDPTPKDQFKVFTYAKVLALFADIINTTGSTEAGFEFERWLSLLLNLPVAGAAKGAADNLGKIIGGSTVYTSAKLYKTLVGKYSPSQSAEKLNNTFDSAPGSSIYYFVGQKKKFSNVGKPEVQGFKFIEAVDLYLIEIFRDGTTLKGRFINKEGNPSSNPWDLAYKEAKDEPTQAILTPQYENANLSDYKFETLLIPGGEISNNQLEMASKYLTRQIQNMSNVPFTKAIMDAATAIKRMEANADSYVSLSSDKKKGGTQYINKITDDYFALENFYDQIFSYGEDDNKKYVEPARQTKTNESKSSLDHLIKTIIKQTLLK